MRGGDRTGQDRIQEGCENSVLNAHSGEEGFLRRAKKDIFQGWEKKNPFLRGEELEY